MDKELVLGILNKLANAQVGAIDKVIIQYWVKETEEEDSHTEAIRFEKEYA